MAGETKQVRVNYLPGSMEYEQVVEHNNLVLDVEKLRAAGQAGAVLATTELMADHATTKATVDALETLAEELGADHATFKTAVDQTETLIEELHDDHATFKTVVDDIKALLNQIRAHLLNQSLGNPGFVIVSNFDTKNANAFSYLNGGVLKSLAADQTFDTGTSQVITADKWSSALLSLSNAAAPTVTWSATLNADDEATAIAALPALPANHTPLGYITVLTGSGVTWTAGTDALTTGTGGTPATTTNYYNAVNPNAAILGAAVSSSAPATLTASKPASGPATLSASTAIPSGPATLSSPVPTGEAIDTATDLVAAKLADGSGTVIA